MIGDLGARDATELAGLVAKGEVSPDELLDAALAAVGARNPAINAVVLVQEEVARAEIRAGLPRGPFRGVPFLIKDLGLEAKDLPSLNGTRLGPARTYAADCNMMARMRATGVVTFGRTTSPEGGVGIATEAAAYGGPTRNPWNTDHTAGGSSGGAAAAVAAGIVAFAHGSDGGGSVRVPASNCGLFGFKPTRARLPDGPWSGEGWAGMAIDGFLTRSVRDTAVMLDACEGPDLGAPMSRRRWQRATARRSRPRPDGCAWRSATRPLPAPRLTRRSQPRCGRPGSCWKALATMWNRRGQRRISGQ